MTTLQRDANRIQGYTAQQTLDYLQALYEKKLCTYPRTDSRYLTNDMAARVPEYVAAAASICDTDTPAEINASQVCDSGKVSDHHAVIPTISAGSAEVEALPLGERVILNLLARRLLSAVSEPYRYLETKASLNCGGHLFSAKGKTVLSPGWKTYSPEQQEKDAALPELTEGQAVPVAGAEVKEGKTSPPKHFTEDTLLSALETAGAKELPENAERKGIGTPATRAGILEKLVSSGLVDRRKSKKVPNLIPTDTGTALITILPEQLQSPLLTAEWEQQLKEIEGGTLAPEDFMAEIAAMLRELIRTYQPVSNAAVLFPSDAEIIGNCPFCGQGVAERKRGFFCVNPACSFALWKNSKFLAAKRKTLTKNMAAVLLKEGCVPLKDCWSEKTGKTYDATLFLDTDGDAARYRIEFEKRRKR